MDRALTTASLFPTRRIQLPRNIDVPSTAIRVFASNCCAHRSVRCDHTMALIPTNARTHSSAFENCHKFDSYFDVIKRLEIAYDCLMDLRVNAKVRVFGEHVHILVSFQSVSYTREGKDAFCWTPRRCFACATVADCHKHLCNTDIPMRWKNLYEIVPPDEPMHLYFDMEESRPYGSSVASHDQLCWAKVQKLRGVVIDTFR